MFPKASSAQYVIKLISKYCSANFQSRGSSARRSAWRGQGPSSPTKLLQLSLHAVNETALIQDLLPLLDSILLSTNTLLRTADPFTLRTTGTTLYGNATAYTTRGYTLGGHSTRSCHTCPPQPLYKVAKLVAKYNHTVTPCSIETESPGCLAVRRDLHSSVPTGTVDRRNNNSRRHKGHRDMTRG